MPLIYTFVNELDEYFYTIKSEETKQTYAEYLQYFEKFIGKTMLKVLKMTPVKIQGILKEYVIDMRDRKLSSSSITGRLAPIFSILELNDIVVNKKKILKFVGERKRTFKDEAYALEDIEKMVNMSKPRTKLIILIYSSTGMRRSALLELKLKHIEKIKEYGIYKFRVYENTKEEYITFCTPECAAAVDQYLEVRKQAGEQLTKESWLIRNDFDVDNPKSVQNPKPTNAINVSTVIRNVLVKAGLRKLGQPKSTRNERPIIHAFRKFATTQFVHSSLNPEIREMLLGHSIGLTGVYYRPGDNDLLKEYVKAMNLLTIDPTFRLKNKIIILEGREKEIESMKESVKQLEEKLEHYRTEKLLRTLNDNGPMSTKDLIKKLGKYE